MIKFIKPQLGEINRYIVTINRIHVLVVTNVEGILNSVVHTDNYIAAKKASPYCGLPTIFILFNSSIDSNYTVHSSNKNDNNNIRSEEIIYPNKLFRYGSQSVLFNFYPNNSIILHDSDKMTYIIVASVKEALVLYLKMYLKKVVLCSIQNLCALHASSVGTKFGGFVFLGQGNAGKSTLALNLCQHGWEMLNDDLIFLSNSSDSINIRGIDINPCVRGESIPYIENSRELLMSDRCMYNKYHDCYYLTSINTLKLSIPLKGIFILQKEFNNSSLLSEITDLELKKEVLKKYIRNDFDVEDQLFLKLGSIPMYKLNITRPISQIVSCLKSFE